MGQAPDSSGIDSKAGRGLYTYPHYHRSGGEHEARELRQLGSHVTAVA